MFFNFFFRKKLKILSMEYGNAKGRSPSAMTTVLLTSDLETGVLSNIISDSVALVFIFKV